MSLLMSPNDDTMDDVTTIYQVQSSYHWDHHPHWDFFPNFSTVSYLKLPVAIQSPCLLGNYLNKFNLTLRRVNPPTTWLDYNPNCLIINIMGRSLSPLDLFTWLTNTLLAYFSHRVTPPIRTLLPELIMTLNHISPGWPDHLILIYHRINDFI